MYFNTLIFGYFNIETLICGLAMRRSRSYLEYNIDQYTFACFLNNVHIFFLMCVCLNVIELECMLFIFVSEKR